MTAKLLGDVLGLIPDETDEVLTECDDRVYGVGESDDVFPADAHEAADVDFLGRSTTELTDAVKTLVGVLALRDTVRDVHQLQVDRSVTDREVNDLVEERIAKWTQVAFDSSASTELRGIAIRGRDTWDGGVDV